jgi:hypothetical protein
MILKEIEDTTLETMNYDSSKVVSDVRARIRRSINDWHRRALTIPGLTRLRDTTITFPTVASQAKYSLPQTISKILNIYEPTTNRIRLVERSVDWLRNMPSTTSGVPEAWIPFGYTPITQLPALTGLWVVSSSASDTMQKAYVEGVRSGGYLDTPSTTALNGTTRVAVGTNTDYVDVLQFALDLPPTGSVSLYDAAASGNELARIPPRMLGSRYYSILLWPSPSSAWTLYVDHSRVITELIQATDTPLLPEDFHYLLGVGARMNEYEYKGQPQMMTAMRADWELGIRNLRDFVENNADYIVIPGQQPRGTRFSNIGSWYPPGTW